MGIRNQSSALFLKKKFFSHFLDCSWSNYSVKEIKIKIKNYLFWNTFSKEYRTRTLFNPVSEVSQWSKNWYLFLNGFKQFLFLLLHGLELEQSLFFLGSTDFKTGLWQCSLFEPAKTIHFLIPTQSHFIYFQVDQIIQTFSSVPSEN
ncbi:hypothetical protein BpHYR1_009379 [Brachionus plicatilis]|uniref:Uncharacterized protein n=1 Tax=Brachionus plicatilis TaxID=10195 RepID=A0A3M7Q8C8_BRAPC|nr:hypothetical protein BpHYR1_009379 [Brachionus plicatilis]